jgi:DNA-binding response OmpR family regulator/HPt (histidine-containing phosphotransfer) domain-containing protein
MPPAQTPREEEARLTGARAEFAGSLPRRLETLREALVAAEQTPDDPDRLKGLLRRVHAVGSAARVLGFASVAEALAEAERGVRQAQQAGKPAPFQEVARAFDVLPSLVLGAPVSERGPESIARPATAAWPTSVLVLGPTTLSSALAESEGTGFECERLEDATRLVELAHIVGPDVIVVDGDHPGARAAITQFFADEMLEPTPIVVVGGFDKPENASAFVELGVERVLPKPCSPDALRRTVAELRQRAAQPRPAREPLGEMTIAGLAERIAGEFKRGLVDALETTAPTARVPLGDGHDVLAAVWGAVARVRELVTLRSGGGMRFEPSGPEGGVPFAPWGGGAERRMGERGAEPRDTAGVALQGRRVLVADDDPAVVWFMAEILRSVGVEVVEAHDGKRALELAFEHWPDAIVSDVLMPKLDGFSLCHEIKRDVALRDVPVILLSWKEDLLQRVRELGADADGYLRKEATAASVVERVREVMRARARVEDRVAAGGEVRGRLDGLTPRLVLELACRGERNVRVSFRDAAFLFEAQVRKGRLVALSRSAADGSFLRGSAVLGSLLGASAGRFSIEPDTSSCRNELSGALFDILKEPIAASRVALAAVSAGALLRLERVVLDRALVETYLNSTPEPAAGVVRRVLEGQSPAELVVSGTVSPRLLELVLSDLARRGGVLSFVAAPPRRSAPPPDAFGRAVTPLEPPVRIHTPPGPIAKIDTDALPPSPPTAPLAVSPPRGPLDSTDRGWMDHDAVAPTAAVEGLRSDSGEAAEAVHGDAKPALRVEGETQGLPLSDQLTPGTEGTESEPTLSFGMEPTTLEGMGGGVPRVAASPSDRSGSEPELGAHMLGLGEAPAEDHADSPPKLGSTIRLEAPPDAASAQGMNQTLRVPSYPAGSGTSRSGSSEPAVTVASLASAEPKPEAAAPHPSQTLRSSEPPGVRMVLESTPPADEDSKRAKTQPPSRVRTAADASRLQPGSEPPESVSSSSVGKLLVKSAIAGAVAFGATTWLLLPLFGEDKTEERPKVAAPATAEPAPPAAAAPAPAAGLTVEVLDPPAGVQISEGQGVIEVETGGPDPIYVDEAFVGLGPLRRVAAAAGAHRVEVRGAGAPRGADIALVAGKRARITAPAAPAPAPSGSSR